MGRYSEKVAPAGMTLDRALAIAMSSLGVEPDTEEFVAPAEELILDNLDERIKDLVAAGSTDQQIADLVPLSRTAIRARRERMHLPANYARAHPTAPVRKEWARITQSVIDMARDGYADQKIADTLGISRDSVRKRREKAGIPLNRVQAAPRHLFRGEESFKANHRLHELWEQGLTDQEIAEVMGMTKEAIRLRRSHLQLPVHRPAHRPRSPENEVRAQAITRLVYAGLSDRQIANELGLTVPMATSTRYALGLPCNRVRPAPRVP